MARTVKPKSGIIRKVVSLKVTLRDTKPPVWRRLLAPGETTLGDLHRAIQAAMGWDDCHLHTFDIEGRQYGDQLLDVLADPAHPEHAERREWLGEDFDPEDFNPAIADATLAARFGHA